MPKPDIPYKDVTGEYTVLDLEKTLEYEDEKWCNRLWLSETLGGDYKLFIKTTVTNNETGKERDVKNWYIVIKQRGWILRNLFGIDRYAKKDLPNIQSKISKQVDKIAENKDSMKSEEELLNEVKKEFKNQLQDVDFESAVEEARKK
jgi:hypothetical protein